MTMTLNGSGTGTVGVPNSATAQNSTSGTSIDFTGIPAGIKRITVMFNGVSISGTSGIKIQIGNASSPETTGYTSICSVIGSGVATLSNTTGFYVTTSGYTFAADTTHGSAILCLQNSSTNSWSQTALIGTTSQPYTFTSGGSKSTSGVVNIVRITTGNGTDTFDAGSINILYE